jgi:hypothetical protein
MGLTPAARTLEVHTVKLTSLLCRASLVGAALPIASATAQSRAPKSLFNGKDLSGWHVDVPAIDSNPRTRNPFIVRNGMLVSLGEPQGHLITDSSYRDYRLEVEYRFPGKPGNAGVLVHASTPRALYKMFPKSIEVQMESGNAGDFWCIVEDITVPDMEHRRGPRAQWGITEGKARRIINLTDNSEKPVGQWNTMVIEAVGRSIKVWVNGDLVNDGSNATADHGRIALQAEGSEVEFRKVLLTRQAPAGPARSATATPDAERPVAVVREYRSNLSGVHAPNPEVKLRTGRDRALAGEWVLLVDYPAPNDNPASRDVRIDAARTNWAAGSAIAFRVRPQHVTRLSVSFLDRNHVVYTAWRELQAGVWQQIRIPFAEIRPNPYFQPPDAKPGAPIDVSDVKFLAFAPQEKAAGHLAVSRFVVIE